MYVSLNDIVFALWMFGFFWLFYQLGRRHAAKDIENTLTELAEQVIIGEEEAEWQNTITIKIEQDGDTLYAWDRETGDFLTQAKTVKELLKNFERDYAEYRILVDEETAERYGIMDAE